MTSVRLHIAGPVAELRLDNAAKLNCFTVEMLGQLSSHLEVIEARPEVRAVIVIGEGDARIRDAVAGPDDTLLLLTTNTDANDIPGPTDDRLLQVTLAPHD